LSVIINCTMDKESDLRKSKNFGLTFSTVLLILTIFFFLKNDEFKIFLFFSSFLLLILSILCPIIFKYPSKVWEKFGEILGRFFSPIILTIIYVLSIIPIKILLFLLNKDLLKKKKSKEGSYWVDRNEDTINFRDQF